MVKIRKYANFIERFLHGEKGQRFFNITFSLGAAVVIWGALFKILHLPGGSTLLCIGMGTEVLMFILTAFDRPPREYAWEKVYPALDDEEVASSESGNNLQPSDDSPGGQQVAWPRASAPGKHYNASTPSDANTQPSPLTSDLSPLNSQLSTLNSNLSPDFSDQLSTLEETTAKLSEAAQTLLKAYESMADETQSLGKSSEKYSDRMDDLNRSIAGLSAIYDIHLKSVSGQLETVERVNANMKELAENMKQINAIYERMLLAMTVNMQAPAASLNQNPKNQ